MIPPPPKGLTESDFEEIEAAVMETERGRWFLAEFARRRRAEDASRILSAIDRLESRAARGEVDRARQRLESERAAEVVRQLQQVLKDLRPLADARVRERKLSERGRIGDIKHEGAKSGPLEHRFAALVELDGRDLEDELKQFG